MSRRRYDKALSIMLLIVMVNIFSCASQSKRVLPSASLDETVSNFYQLKKDKKIEEAWYFERRSIASKNADDLNKDRGQYIQREAAMPLKDFTIIEIGKEGSHAKGFTPVKVRLIGSWPPMNMKMPEGDRVQEFDDLWERIDGKWYHVIIGLTGTYW
ncbi:MAG: hypothetical protein HZA15_05055 [Nitrospirae bacterium]|nr:hypothetical protein [Nitrospirota bacterium]